MNKWGYGQCCGPETWTNNFSPASGKNQSPINIIVENTHYDERSSGNNIQIKVDETLSTDQVLHFTGHSFKVETSKNPITVTGAYGLEQDVFKLVQFHFHWGGSAKENGSEHQINGRGWPTEVHLVHYNSTKYSNFCDAADKPDGLLVIGVFFQIGNQNQDLQNLIKYLDNIHIIEKIDLHARRSTLNLRNLLPKNTDRYFTYSGSLTTPPCYESVTWIVFEEPLEVSEDQLLQFRKVHNDECGTALNYRPVCPVNDRKIKRSFK